MGFWGPNLWAVCLLFDTTRHDRRLRKFESLITHAYLLPPPNIAAADRGCTHFDGGTRLALLVL